MSHGTPPRMRKAPGAVDFIARGLARRAGITELNDGFGIETTVNLPVATVSIDTVALDARYDEREYSTYLAFPFQQSEVVMGWIAPFAGNLADDFNDWLFAITGSNPSANTTFTVRVNGSSVGSFTINTSGVFSATTTGGSVPIASGDRVTVTAGSNADVALSATNVLFTARLNR